MPSNAQDLIRSLVAGEGAFAERILTAARTSDDPTVLVAAALLGSPEFLDRARQHAKSTRDRQIVAIADAHQRGDRDLVDALAREHLVDHPDSVLVAWIASASHSQKEES